MPVFYTKPVLRDLSQGSRIAYVRQFRHMTQEELGEKIEMSPGRRRNRICRYERGTRNPKDDRVEKMAEVLEINEAMIKSYDFKDPMDIVYILLWLEKEASYSKMLEHLMELDEEIKLRENEIDASEKKLNELSLKRDEAQSLFEEYDSKYQAINTEHKNIINQIADLKERMQIE